MTTAGTRIRKTVVAAAAGLLTSAGVAIAPGVAAAEQADLEVHLTYPVTGTTHLKSTDSTLALGPGTLSTTTELPSGDLTASLDLPPATGSFKEFGVIPITATTEFIQQGPTTGQANLITGHVQSTSHIILRLVAVEVAGIPVPVGDQCQTRVPATVELESEPGFNVQTGGTMTGTYAIPKFEGCGLATPLINLTIPGSGNTITLELGHAL